MDLKVAENLAKEMMLKHGLLAPTWSFKFNNAKSSYGRCKTRFNRTTRVITTGTIILSKPLTEIGKYEDVLDTILHEIAHGLTPSDGHGWAWKRKCVEIGARPIRCSSHKNQLEIVSAPARYQAVCGGCGITHEKSRMTAKSKYTNTACMCQRGKSWSDKILLKFIDTKAV